MGKIAGVLAAAAVALWLFVGTTAGQAADETLGELADPERIAFEGVTAFTLGAVMGGVFDDIDLLLAFRPSAPRAVLLQRLARGVLTGYRHAGFPRVTAEARVVDNPLGITVHVVEGPRLTAGHVKAEGFPPELGQAVVRALTTPRPDPADLHAPTPHRLPPLWMPGSPAPFDLATRKRMEKTVRESLDRAGFMSAEFTVSASPDEDSGTARLRAVLVKRGPRTTIGKIELWGRIRPATQQVLREYLGIAEGMPLDLDLVDALRRNLRTSGRFLSERVWTEAPDENGKVVLRINAIESRRAPALTLTPGASERALRGVIDWLAKVGETGAVLIADIRTDALQADVIWSPRAGIVVDCRLADAEDFGIESGTLALSRDCSLLVVKAGGVARGARTGPLPNLTPVIRILANPDGAEQPFSLQLAVSARSGRNSKRWPRLVEVHPTPVMSILGGQYTESDGTAELKHHGMRLRVDLATGAPLAFDSLLTDWGGQMEARTESGTFGKRLAETAARVGATELTVSGPPDWPFVGIAGLAMEQILVPWRAYELGKPDLARPASAAVRKIMTALVPHLLAEAREYDAGWTGKESDARFVVPGSVQSEEPTAASRRALLPGIHPSLAYTGGLLFPRDSWAAVLTREVIHLLAGHRDGVRAELRRILVRGRIGPIGCLVGASIPSFLLADRRAFAELGLENLDVAAFRRDYEMLLFATESSVVSRTFCMVLRALRDVEPIEARALAEMIGPDAGRLLLECHAALQGADLGADWARTVRPVLDRAWETWLKKSVKAALERRNR